MYILLCDMPDVKNITYLKTLRNGNYRHFLQKYPLRKVSFQPQGLFRYPLQQLLEVVHYFYLNLFWKNQVPLFVLWKEGHLDIVVSSGSKKFSEIVAFLSALEF